MVETAIHNQQKGSDPFWDFSEMMRRLNAETDLEAANWFRERRKVWFPSVAWKMFLGFKKVYFLEGGFRRGFFGFMRAVHSSLYQLVSYSKYWEFVERERGHM